MKEFIINSELIQEWNWKKNNELGLYPDKVTLGSGKKVWWLCSECGHEWQTSPNSRDNMNSGCPECSKGNRVSSAELKVYYYIKKYFSDAVSSYSDKTNDITELDIYIPSLHIGIEYDGGRWHQDIKKDKNKDMICKNNNIKLIRIRDMNCPEYNGDCTIIHLTNKSLGALENAIVSVLNILGIQNPKISFDKDITQIENLILHKKQINSLADLYPRIAQEWHLTKNGNLTPQNVKPKSDKKVWWVCSECGYEWVTSVKTRTKGCGCPQCALIELGKSRKKLHDDFLAQLAKVNNNIIPLTEYTNSKESIRVFCNICKHEWSVTPDNLLQGKGCPKCAREKNRQAHCKMVYCAELNQTFESGVEASRYTGVSYTGIMACINGKQKSAGRHPITNIKLTWKEIK